MMAGSRFLPLSAFESGRDGYDLLPFRFLRWEGEEVLLVNEVGDFVFAGRDLLARLIQGRLDPDEPLYRQLKAKHFLSDGDTSMAIERLATQFRTKKSFLLGFTSLHLFVVTLRCDHSCLYCQVSRVTQDRERFDMSFETASRSIDLMFRSPSPDLTVELQGGEPLLHFDLVRFIVETVLERNESEKRRIQFVVATTLLPLDAETLAFLRQHDVLLSTSLDGPEWLHDANRPRPGKDSHRRFEAKLAEAREALGHDRISALMTTSSASLGHPRSIVDEYARLGFRSIFLRAISPYGFAARGKGDPIREMDEFLSFYRAAFERIVELNRSGVPMVEIYAQILLRKILTPFPSRYVDLQSPSGVGIGGVAYNYDGEVYPCDEARMLAAMGDGELSLGNVHRHSYEAIFGGAKLRSLVAGSIIESLPGCHECAFVPYCGADPLFHYRTQGDPIGHRPTSAFCRKNMAILKHLFGLLRSGEPFVQRLFVEWATGVSPFEDERQDTEDREGPWAPS